MDRSHAKSCSRAGRNLPGRLAMLASLPAYRLAPCLLLVLLVCPAGGQPVVDAQRKALQEAVKAGILSSLGLEQEPRPPQKASAEELQRVYQSYWDRLREMGGNSSQALAEAEQRSSVHPGELITLLRRGGGAGSGGHVQWYRAVFHLQAELTLARAELKVSRPISNRTTSALAGGAVKLKVGRRKRLKSAAWLDADPAGSAEARLDISSQVRRWMRSGGRQGLVVDVGVAAGEATPAVSLELDLRGSGETRGGRAPRSAKEDECGERGLCCRRSVVVSFKDLGWTDWVVAPAEYTMHFCDGACPHNYRPASMHTQVKSRLHQMTKGGAPGPCCVPAAYEPMVLMHYDSRGNLRLTPFEDLIVSECHCA